MTKDSDSSRQGENQILMGTLLFFNIDLHTQNVLYKTGNNQENPPAGQSRLWSLGFFSIESVRALLIAEETEAQGWEDSCGYTGHNGRAQASDPSVKGSKSPQTNTAPLLAPGIHAMSSEDRPDWPEASLCGLEANLMSLHPHFPPVQWGRKE